MKTYLPAVDGLRAIAVLAVVAYHAGAYVPAGFVGVDVFFVISGFLITRLLYQEVKATGQVDFKAFYLRRARRILPALAVVIVATLLLAMQMLPPTVQKSTADSAVAASLFIANLFFYVAPNGYFDPAAESMPLLHLWSLGVEEQFYLVWPIVLILARKRPVIALASIAIVSFGLASVLDHNAAFYLMPSRAWELALGGLVALRPVNLPRGSAWVGLGIVLASCAFPLPHFPGIGALPAVLGSALLINAIQQGQRSILESKPFVWIGLISYSLYLWHWPVLLFGKMVHWHPAVLVGIAFVLATISYKWIETPFRRGVSMPKVGVFATLALCCMSASAVAMHKDAEEPTPPEWAGVPSIYLMKCDDWIRSATVKPCVFGPKDATKTVVVLGDSIGVQWFPAFYKIFHDWKLIVITKSACPMVNVPYVYGYLQRRYTECESWRKDALAEVSKIHPDLLILGSADEYPFTLSQWYQGTKDVLGSVKADQIKILQSTPTSSQLDNLDVLQQITKVASEFDNVSVISMNDLVCPNRQCPLKKNGKTLFWDGKHLRKSLIHELAPDLQTRLMPKAYSQLADTESRG